MEKIVEKIKHYNIKFRERQNFRLLFAVIGVLTVVNLGANLFNSYIAFSAKADSQELREAQAKITASQKDIEMLHDEAEMRVQSVLATTNAVRDIQLHTVKALTRSRVWTEEEKRTISSNWKNVWYEGVENPFPEYAGEMPPK